MVPSRRTFLASAGPALFGLAGCTENPLTEDGTKIANVHATNHRETSHTFTAVIEDGDETVYFESIELPGKTDNAPTGTDFENVPSAAANYTVYGYLDDQPREEWKELELDSIAASCVEICLCIDSTAEEFAIWYSKDCGTND